MVKPIITRTIFGALLLGLASSSLAGSYTLVVQPFLSTKETTLVYTPLAKYLSDASGHSIKLKTQPNFLTYWLSMKSGQYDFLLDAAHLTDYRAQKMDYQVIGKVQDVVSLSLVTAEDVLVFEPSELIGKRIASLASPSRGAVVLNEFFPNSLRQPVIVEVKNAQDAIQKVLTGKASGAIIPSPLVGNYPQLNIVTTTEQWPHVALSASSRVPADVTKKIQNAILNASKTQAGREMLQASNIQGFEPADAKLYEGYSKVLKSVWGYEESLDLVLNKD